MTAFPQHSVTISRRFISSAIAIIAIAIFIMLATMMLYQRAALSEAGEPFLLPVNTTIVTAQPAYQFHEYYAGRVEALRRVDVSFEQPGKLEQINVDEGAVVRAGDVLAAQDTMIVRANREQTAAALERIEAQLELAKLTEDRRKQLFAQGHINEQQYDEARLNTQSLLAQMKEAQAALKTIDVTIEKSVLRAPFDGTIGQRFVDEGGVVNAGTPVLSLLEGGAQIVRVSMPPRLARDVIPGQDGQIIHENKTVAASVYAVRKDVNPQTRTQDVLYKIMPGQAMAIGELVQLKMTSKRDHEGYWVPTEALVEGNKGLWNIFEVVSQGGGYAVKKRSVEIIHAETSRVYVAANLSDQARIVSNGTHRIVPGQIVSLAKNEGR